MRISGKEIERRDWCRGHEPKFRFFLFLQIKRSNEQEEEIPGDIQTEKSNDSVLPSIEASDAALTNQNHNIFTILCDFHTSHEEDVDEPSYGQSSGDRKCAPNAEDPGARILTDQHLLKGREV